MANSELYNNAIARPSFSCIDALVKGAVGFGIACLSQTNKALWTLILVAQSVATPIFYKFIKMFIPQHLKTGKTIALVADISRAISYGITIVALEAFKLISLRMAGVLGAFGLLFLLARVNYIYTTDLPQKRVAIQNP